MGTALELKVSLTETSDFKAAKAIIYLQGRALQPMAKVYSTCIVPTENPQQT